MEIRLMMPTRFTRLGLRLLSRLGRTLLLNTVILLDVRL